MTQYIKINSNTREVIMGFGRPDPVDFAGPLQEAPIAEEGFEYLLWQKERLNFGGKTTDSMKLYWYVESEDPEWVETASVDEIKAIKNAEINESRLKANRSFFMFAGKKIACDELSRSDIDAITSEVSLTQVLPASFPMGWKTMDNSYVSIPDVATWIQFVRAMVNQGSSNFAHAQALKAQLASASTVAQVRAIKWDN